MHDIDWEAGESIDISKTSAWRDMFSPAISRLSKTTTTSLACVAETQPFLTDQDNIIDHDDW